MNTPLGNRKLPSRSSSLRSVVSFDDKKMTQGAMADAIVMTSKSKCSPPQPRGMEDTRLSFEPSPLRHSLEISKDLFNRVNSNRKLCGSSPLNWSEMLCEAASYHNIEMGNDGKESQSEFHFGASYTEMILRLIAGSGQNFLSEKRRPSKITKNLMKLWTSRSSWNNIMLDPIAKYCAIAVAVNETHVYCTAIFSMYEAYKFPPVTGNTAYIDYSQRMRAPRPINWSSYDLENEYSFNRHRRDTHENRRPFRVEPMFCCDLFVALKSLFYSCFPDGEIEEIGGALYDSRPEIEIEP